MKRINKNINTEGHWDQVYSGSPFLDIDEYRYTYFGHLIEGGEVVDLGCGDGKGIQAMKKIQPKAHFTGVDHSQTGILKANQLGVGDFFTANLPKSGLPDESFDYVVSSETLEHMDEPQQLINEMYRLLKKGGKAILSTPYLDHIPSKEHVWEFDYPDVERMFFKFDKVWVFPWAGGTEVHDLLTDRTIYPVGNWCTIMCLAIK